MSRCAVAVLAFVMLVTLQAPVHAQTSIENWATGVVRAIGKSLPVAVPGAAKSSKSKKAAAQSSEGSDATSDKTVEMAAQDPDLVPPLPERKKVDSIRGRAITAVVPQRPGKKPDTVPDKEPETWSPKEVAEAKAQCAALLKGLDAVTIPQAPIHEGRCGTPAPIHLVSIGKKPDKVTFSPPALVTCDLAAALAKWIDKDLQPLANKHLGSRITKVEVMSDYSCRNVAGVKRLSEHGLVNALDIRGFVTKEGKRARVLAGWGKTKRDLAREIAVAEAEAKARAKAEAEAKAEAKAKAEARKSDSRDDDAPVTASLAQNRDRSDDPITVAAKLNGPPPPPTRKKDGATQYASLSHLPERAGAPPPAQVVPPKLILDGKARFLRAAHAAGCRIFGTTLGPEANRAHRNHFHVDMAERKWKKICD